MNPGFMSAPAIRLARFATASVLFLVLCFSPFMVTTVSAVTTPYISFQGKLTNTDGTNVADGNYTMVFAVYSEPTGGTAVWSESKPVPVEAGLFHTNLGDATSLPGSINFNSSTLYLGVKVGTDAEMSPRVRLTSSPQAFNSDLLDGLDSSNLVQLSPGSRQTGNINISGSLASGAAGASQGAIILSNAIGANTVTLQAPNTNPTSSFGITLPSNLGNSGDCLKQTDVSGTLSFSSCASTLQATYDASSPATISTTSGKGVSIVAGAAPTVDLLSIDNSSYPSTTADANGLSINYAGGNAPVEAAGMRIDYTPGSASGGTWSGLRLVANSTGPASGVTSYGIKLEGPSVAGAGSSVAISVASGFDIGLDVSSGGLQLANMDDPSAPAVGSLRIFAQTRAGRTLLKIKGPSGISTAFQPALFANKVGWWTSQGSGTSVSVMNFGNTASGTATSRSVATTSLFTSMRRIGYVSATTAGSAAGTRHALAQFWRGNAEGLGGFFYVARFGISQTQTTMRSFVGLSATTGALSNANPSTFLNSLGFGCDLGESQFTFMHNDASGTATKDALTGSFPCTTANANMYEARIFSPPNSATLYYSLQDISTGAVYDGSTTTKLPSFTTLMSPQIWVNNGTTAAAVGVDVVSQYMETDN